MIYFEITAAIFRSVVFSSVIFYRIIVVPKYFTQSAIIAKSTRVNL
jgi:hypothetical protein